jgi:purine-cytosine permease-like protein
VVGWIGLLVLQGVTGLGIFNFLVGLATIGWVVLTVLGGAKALQGDDWTNPVKKVVKVEALTEK